MHRIKPACAASAHHTESLESGHPRQLYRTSLSDHRAFGALGGCTHSAVLLKFLESGDGGDEVDGLQQAHAEHLYQKRKVPCACHGWLAVHLSLQIQMCRKGMHVHAPALSSGSVKCSNPVCNLKWQFWTCKKAKNHLPASGCILKSSCQNFSEMILHVRLSLSWSADAQLMTSWLQKH